MDVDSLYDSPNLWGSYGVKNITFLGNRHDIGGICYQVTFFDNVEFIKLRGEFIHQKKLKRDQRRTDAYGY